MEGNEKVQRERKRPKETLSKAKAARVPFEDQPRKTLWISQLLDKYNFNVSAVDQHDHMASQNEGLGWVRRGDSQDIEH